MFGVHVAFSDLATKQAIACKLPGTKHFYFIYLSERKKSFPRPNHWPTAQFLPYNFVCTEVVK